MAWDKDTNKIAVVKAIDWGANNKIVTCHLEYADGTVKKKYPEKDYGDDIEFLEFTGLKDKNGIEIYEGYIVAPYTRLAGKNDKKYACLLPVEYEPMWGAFVLNHVDIKHLYLLNEFQALEIIGNIYENPELLNQR